MSIVSYPVLRCILEHIEADCRLTLSARSLKISKFGKSIPLRMDLMWLTENCRVEINHTGYKVISEDPDKDVTHTLCRVYNYKSGFSVKRKFLKNYGVEVATRKIFEYLFGGRNSIRVKRVIVHRNGYKNMQYLFGTFNMKVNSLTSSGSGLSKFHSHLETPLKELIVDVSHLSDFENPIVRTAEIIEITNYGIGLYNDPNVWLETLRNLPNKEVIVREGVHGLTDTSILELIEHWRETRKATGSSFHLRKTDSVVLLKKAKERFKGTYVKLKETDRSTFFNIKAVSINIDSESEIVVYINVSRWTGPSVVIKVMTVGSSVEISEPLKKPKVIPTQPSNYSALVVIPFLTLMIALCLRFFC
ncbi:hypothetical protein B9Z55_007007 [Caenorhabditis nigoni]|uniref:F-box associated domain-containing protein n=1 Tax=Caenorhabditis nigoni TaxID=1611254 RepID=A0A2G5V7T2_9PELO|nr:hypothetical protein B9Z55_007007 [Caenorhabditis nigoni]